MTKAKCVLGVVILLCLCGLLGSQRLPFSAPSLNLLFCLIHMAGVAKRLGYGEGFSVICLHSYPLGGPEHQVLVKRQRLPPAWPQHLVGLEMGVWDGSGPSELCFSFRD